MKRYAVLIVASLGLVACTPESGEVVDKHYSEGYEYPVTQCRTVPQPNGTSRQDCWTEYRWQPDRWYLELENVNADGETVTGERPVPEVTYGDCRIGDWYENGDCS